eukprot:g705.t1
MNTNAVPLQQGILTRLPTALSFFLEALWILVRGLSSFFVNLLSWLKYLYTKQLQANGVELPQPYCSKVWTQPSPSRCLSGQWKLTVVLDLDETLVMTYLKCKIPKDLQISAQLGKLESLQLHCDLGNGKQQKLVVFLRPGLVKFLKSLAMFSEVILYSAAVRAYARPLVDALDPQRQFFTKRLFRDSTVCTGVYKYVKDLSKLGSDLRRTVLVDNRAISFLLQPQNGIKCLPFRGNDKDRELNKVILPLLESLSFLRDVRPTLNNAFRMEKWFKSKGFLL